MPDTASLLAAIAGRPRWDVMSTAEALFSSPADGGYWHVAAVLSGFTVGHLNAAGHVDLDVGVWPEAATAVAIAEAGSSTAATTSSHTYTPAYSAAY